jgi:FlaA1/EpsC-like NDP-sugar epimerase
MRPFRLACQTLCIQKRSFSYSRTFNSQKLDSKSGLLAGKRCIITGASRGIGAEIAHRFASEGARCLLIGRNKNLLEKVRSDLKTRWLEEGEEHEVLVGDVGSGKKLWDVVKKEVRYLLFLFLFLFL